ncbi:MULTISPECIES: NrdR family transcriptional regulator [Eisenbergiella]|uniref:Transcriptional repressor NrdR-like N-terminal domain-containing protein n=1 Tax=Eisenbergiella porci TaxID=2652274 RepID=A0A6N7WJJ0_9FIRM|nr:MULTISPECIES: hypothetical protein [Eisenbergiella]MSS90883.1 hypothetical protein [Eisenbergiella porci]
MHRTVMGAGEGIPEIMDEIGNSDGVFPQKINGISQEYGISSTVKMKYAEGGKCPYCRADSEIIETRYWESMKSPVRRRQCKACGQRWDTVGIRIKERRNDY